MSDFCKKARTFALDNNDQKATRLPDAQDRPIQLVVNRPQSNEVTIDLGNVFHNMKMKRRIYAWLLVLCLTVGLCAPLLLYQFTKPQLTVSSIAVLRYDVPVKEWVNGEYVVPENPEYVPVTDLTAPDGEPLDLNQITSSYVLQSALNGLSLSRPVSAAQLRSNLRIQTILTEESRRTQEALAGLAEAKNAEAYNRLESAEMKYQNRFIVSLSNGFGEEDSRVKTELKDDELKQVLNRVLTAYNDYLVKTYADVKLPEDKFAAIDIRELDILESLDQLRAGIDGLADYIDEKPGTVRTYRSARTGRSLEDWEETLKTFRNINVDYLYTMVSENAVTRDKIALLTTWKYQLRNTQNELDKLSAEIEETRKILANYQNDNIYISMQESDDTRTTKAATEYYNKLVLLQAENYHKAQELKQSALDYEDRIRRMEDAEGTEVTEAIEEELSRSLSTAQSLYNQIREHMEEVFSSPMYTSYEDHSVPQGKLENFLTANLKKMIIGAVVGAVLACGIWFLAGLAPEFSKNRKAQETGREAAKK